MADASPDLYRRGHNAPSGGEAEFAELIIEGKLPETLRGSFYRNGPDPQFPPHPDDTYHPFDGDGMIYAFNIADRGATLRNRWVRTPKFLAERAAGKRLFGVFGNPRFNDPAANPADYDTANTHIWPHAGRLYALMEGRQPTEIDPLSLETIGYESFAGEVTGPFTAHPKLDPVTGELFAFGWGAKGPGSKALRYNIISADGRTARTEWLEQPYCSMMHDMVLTENYVIFPCLPLTFSLERAMSGKPPTAWESNLPAWFGIMPRYGTAADLRWIEADPTFAFHVAGAHERPGGEIVIEVAGSNQAPLMPDASGRMPLDEASRMTLRRWIVAADRSGVREERVDELAMQFPRIDDRVNGRRYRSVFFNGAASAESVRADGFDTIGSYDLHDDKRVLHIVDGGFFGEPVFVPRPGGGEGDGHVLATLWQPGKQVSSLEIFDAQAIGDGPVARVVAPTRIPAGFHCSWRDAG